MILDTAWKEEEVVEEEGGVEVGEDDWYWMRFGMR
jgi:hypothetical protein